MRTFLSQLKKLVLIYSIVLIITILLTFFIAKAINLNPEALFDDLNLGIASDELHKENPTAFGIFIGLFNNNIMVPLQILLLALIPIPFVYAISLIFNGIAIGSVFFIYQKIQQTYGEGESLAQIIVKDFLPHAVIELFAFVIATALAYRINQWLIRQIANLFRKDNKRDTYYSFQSLLGYTIKTFIIIILPLIIIAAWIEAYITPLI